MTENLTRAEARDRSAAVTVASYEVALDLTGSGPTFPSTTTAVFDSTVASTWIDLIAERVRAITLNGVAVDPASAFTGARVQLTGLQAHNTVTIEADCVYMNTGEGLHRFVDPVDDETYLYTQFESADARRMYACFEQPDMKATFALTVEAPTHWQVVSNSPTPDPVAVREGVLRWTFEPTPRISTYITALVAGPYHRVRDSYTGRFGTYPMDVYCRTSLAEYLDADDILLITKQGFAYYEDQFGVPYPFPKYDQLFVPEFNAGAMENAGCVTFLEDFVFRSRETDAAYEQRANTILHELAHMWFGDLVTMTWWDDLWLNESFAEWAAHWSNANATRYADAWTTFSNQRKAWAYRQDQLPSTHPIAADMVDLDAVRVNFDGITYAKGASALRQLVAWVGEPEFLAGVRAYFGKHAWGNTELKDLLSELEVTSGRDLTEWTHQWLQTSGVNLLRPLVAVGADGAYTSVVIEQEPPTVPEGVAPTLRSHRIGLGLYDLVGDQLVLRERREIDVVGARTEVPALVGVNQPDLLLVNDGDLTFAKVRMDERSWRTATRYLGTLQDSLARALIWGAAWDMTRDAEVPTGEFVQLVTSGIGSEPDIGVVQVTLRQCSAAIDQYATPEHRDGYLLLMAQTAERLAREAESGSDRQLAFTRTFISNARTPEHLAVVAGLLDGTVTWPGLAVDTDLRWTMLMRLVASGVRGDEDIEAELVRDATATGARSAATARAARPTAVAKELAWADAIDRTDLPNAMLDATIGGFQTRDHIELMQPYRDAYFEVLPRVWAERTMEIATSITVGLFPFFIIDQSTVDAAARFLATEGLHPAMARLVGENRDGMERAMRARTRDGQV